MKTAIVQKLLVYVQESSVSFAGDINDIPLDTSLIEEGILDSYGIVELVSFIETTWSIKILPSDFTKEKMGSINLMAVLIGDKLGQSKMQ